MLLLAIIGLTILFGACFVHGVLLRGRVHVLEELVHVEARLEQPVVHRAQCGAQPVRLRAVCRCVVQSLGEFGDQAMWRLGQGARADPEG